MARERKQNRILSILVVACLYFILGRIGLSVSMLQVSPVWPPSGMALAALVLRGNWLWPGIWIGAFVLNGFGFFDANHPWQSMILTFFIATGATLEALAGRYLVNRYCGGSLVFGRARHVFRFAYLAAFLTSIISALIGGTGLLLAHRIAASDWQSTMFTWWIGDAMGILVVTPLLLSWSEQSEYRWTPRGVLEVFLLLFAIAIIAVCSFSSIEFHIEYMLIPCLMWAAFRFDRRGATTVVAIVSFIAITGTSRGHGAFILNSPNTSLLMLQTYLGGIAITTLMLSAVLAERLHRSLQLMAAMQEADRARQEAEEANKAKSAFLFNMNHELRTPLNHIIGYSDLLKEEATDSGKTEMLPDIEKIRDAGAHLLDNISGILDLSALETGNMELEKKTYSIRELVAEVLELSKPLAEKNNNRLTVELKEGPDSMFSDRDRVRQVLLAILNNACKFTSGGEVRLEVTPGEQDVTFAVRDTGDGIEPGLLGHIFRPFAQGSSGATKKYGGFGIGLATSRLLCQLLGGDITAASEPSRGSTFTVTLPRS